MDDCFLADPSKLRNLVAQIFQQNGLSEVDSRTFAKILVEADLMGVESHGSARVAGYVKMIHEGWINLRPNVSIISETPSITSIDGDGAAGTTVGENVMQIAIEKCQRMGVSCVTARNLGHTGMAGYYPLLAAEKGFIALWLNNAPRNIPPYGGITPLLGTNPLAAALPVANSDPIMLDMATTIVSMGQIRLASKLKKAIPDFWAFDSKGFSTTDPDTVLNNGFAKWIGAYKGYGLALMIEAFTSVLSGGVFGKETPPLPEFGAGPIRSNAFALVIDPSRFLSPKEFDQRMLELKSQLKESALAPGFAEILMPGELGFRTKSIRQKTGIPIDQATVAELALLAKKHALSFEIEVERLPERKSA